MTWAYDLDMLAQAGVLSFDAPSYIRGQSPRYIGNPTAPSPYPVAPGIEQPFINGQQRADEFKSSKDGLSPANPDWKKWALGAVAIVTMAFGLYKLNSKIIPYFKNFGPNFINSCKIGWKSFKNLFKKNP
jgi:hypothetical protein